MRKILWETNYGPARTGFDFPDRASARFYLERFLKYCKDEGVDGGTTAVLSKIEHAYELAIVEYNGKRLGMEFLLSSPAMGLAFDPSDEVQKRLFNNYVSSGGDYYIPEKGDYVNIEDFYSRLLENDEKVLRAQAHIFYAVNPELPMFRDPSWVKRYLESSKEATEDASARPMEGEVQVDQEPEEKIATEVMSITFPVKGLHPMKRGSILARAQMLMYGAYRIHWLGAMEEFEEVDRDGHTAYDSRYRTGLTFDDPYVHLNVIKIHYDRRAKEAAAEFKTCIGIVAKRDGLAITVEL